MLVAEEPARGLGSVARIGVLGREHDERAPELLVDRRQQERKRRLRDAGAGVGQRLEERAEALAVGELANERVEDGSVHDERRNRRSAGPIVSGRREGRRRAAAEAPCP